MKRALKIAAVLGFAGVLAAAVLHAPAQGRNQDIKQLMGNNFGQLQSILVNLIRSDYRTLPHDVDIIATHAGKLSKAIPASVGGKDEQFLSMAYSLQTHAKSLKLITEILGEHDRGATPGAGLNIDYLRNSAAAHFGQMVTACVACHNQFRRRMLK
jgi:cytochrome c556